jgi:ribulose-phosphate 3-epimerase
MYSNDLSSFFVSVISDSPKNVFLNLETFVNYQMGGLHFDVMDGTFVPRLGLHPELLSELRESSELFIEVHMMLTNPSRYVEVFAEAGANRLLFHIETRNDLDFLITKTKALGLEVGLVINPTTSIKDAINFLPQINSVMLMAIQPGIPRHPFLDSTYSKLSELTEVVKRMNLKLDVQIDGGVTFSNAEKLLRGGAKTLICGSGTIFAPSNSIESNIRKLLEISYLSRL